MLEHPECEWQNSYLLYLKVHSEKELLEWKSKLTSVKEVSSFREPDLDNQVTALAVYGAKPGLFDNLRLL